MTYCTIHKFHIYYPVLAFSTISKTSSCGGDVCCSIQSTTLVVPYLGTPFLVEQPATSSVMHSEMGYQFPLKLSHKLQIGSVVQNVRESAVACFGLQKTLQEHKLRLYLWSSLRLCIAVAVGLFSRVVVAACLPAIQRGALVALIKYVLLWLPSSGERIWTKRCFLCLSYSGQRMTSLHNRRNSDGMGDYNDAVIGASTLTFAAALHCTVHPLVTVYSILYY